MHLDNSHKFPRSSLSTTIFYKDFHHITTYVMIGYLHRESCQSCWDCMLSYLWSRPDNGCIAITVAIALSTEYTSIISGGVLKTLACISPRIGDTCCQVDTGEPLKGYNPREQGWQRQVSSHLCDTWSNPPTEITFQSAHHANWKSVLREPRFDHNGRGSYSLGLSSFSFGVQEEFGQVRSHRMESNCGEGRIYYVHCSQWPGD